MIYKWMVIKFFTVMYLLCYRYFFNVLYIISTVIWNVCLENTDETATVQSRYDRFSYIYDLF
jgi:hypothetical protein